ncbi:hypothetical protein [Pseudomonas savastanoi]|uniref:hypothetical protein n=1 Tax=Pseudomonas savastanoi TaxID=29438 RepID=UPI00070AD815|nr:hypothetical protein [Pseudomonas savastanoi]KWT11043.1 hypothetical protein AL047_13645 [Pseudomonas syringae pv. broussonetiae]
MRNKLSFGFLITGIIFVPQIVSQFISTSLFVLWGLPVSVAFTLYAFLSFILIASALALLHVAGVKLSAACRANGDLEHVSEPEEPHVKKPAKGKVKLAKAKEFTPAKPEKKGDGGGWFSSFADESSGGDSSGGGGDGGGGGD